MHSRLKLYRPVAYEQPEIMLSKLPPTRDIYEAVEADHEYEIPDKYNQPQYDDVKIPPPMPEPAEAESVQLRPLPSTGDYEFTQCPAYVPVVTTTSSIHGSGDKLESISELPSPAQ